MHQNPWEGLLSTDSCSPSAENDAVSMRWGPRMCMSNRFPGDVDVVQLGTTLGDPLLYIDMGDLHSSGFIKQL